MQVPAYVNTVLERLWAAGYEAYPVGGCVRDRLMGREPEDWDLCTSARPEETAAVFSDLRQLDAGVKHGTLTVFAQGRPVEITTFRRESGYADNRHPDGVEFVTRLAEDLGRRDFTVNAMALDRDGAVIDLWGGQEDLARGVIRCVGRAEARFQEDALRILRALRFAARLSFSLEAETASAAVENRALLHSIAPERIFSELKGILTGPGAGAVLRDFPEIFFEIIPELRPLYGFAQHSPHHRHDVWLHTTCGVEAVAPEVSLRLAMLLHDVGKPACFSRDEAGVGHFYGHARAGEAMAEEILRRLRCDNETRDTVGKLIHYHDIQPPQTTRAARRLLTKLGEGGVRRLAACWRADNADRSQEVRRRNLEAIARAEALLAEVLAGEVCFSPKELAVNGGDILALGVEKGPGVGAVLEELFRLVTEEELPNDRKRLLEKAAELAAGKKGCDLPENILQ